MVAVLLAGCAASSPNDTASNVATPGAPLAAAAEEAGQFAALTKPAVAVEDKSITKLGAIAAAPGAVPAADIVAARKSAASLVAAAKPGSSGYKIGPLDVLEVSVFKVPDLSKSVQVADGGTINLPLVGEVMAAGRTARDVEQDLTKQLGKSYLQNPQVTVFVKEYNSQRVTVEGAVKKPGVFPIQTQMSLIQSLALAQGLDVNSDSSVIVFRDVAGKRTAARFDVSAIRAGTAPDPSLQAGDLVVAGNSTTKEAFNAILKALPIASLFGGL